MTKKHLINEGYLSEYEIPTWKIDNYNSDEDLINKFGEVKGSILFNALIEVREHLNNELDKLERQWHKILFTNYLYPITSPKLDLDHSQHLLHHHHCNHQHQYLDLKDQYSKPVLLLNH